uniref:Uncharacterized protein n=1 Tax=Romanomermis culicivorax TaxID=13658 RepID=A0A915KXL6_ROMCU
MTAVRDDGSFGVKQCINRDSTAYGVETLLTGDRLLGRSVVHDFLGEDVETDKFVACSFNFLSELNVF